MKAKETGSIPASHPKKGINVGALNTGGSNVTAKRITVLEIFKSLSQEKGLDFSVNSNLLSPDSSTLFTTSGMQSFKSLFNDSKYHNTFSNVQKCLRLNDLSEVGDGTHRLTFDMVGLFSFRQWSLPEGIDFMIEFLKRINLTPDYVTIHPDKISEWSSYYSKYNLPIKSDPDCLWSDGSIGGYCTEFYINGIEIGNIVNPLGTCLDIGFGLERILLVSNSLPTESRLELLEQTCEDLINSGVTISHNQQGYILKKLITICVLEGSLKINPEFQYIRDQQIKHYQQYLINKQKRRLQSKNSEFWLNTYGIDEKRLILYEQLLKNRT